MHGSPTNLAEVMYMNQSHPDPVEDPAASKAGPRVNLMGLGAQKSATDWLYDVLSAHPGVEMGASTRVKELNFFNVHYAKGFVWYHNHFEFDRAYSGEYSVSYLPDRNVPRRVHDYNPNMKFVVSLRNPIDRAFSHHKHQIQRDRLPGAYHRFEKALEQNPSYLEYGMYASQLKRYLSYFPVEQFHVVWFEEIVEQPERVCERLFDFLGIDTSVRPHNPDRKRNASRVYRSRFLQNLRRNGAAWIRTLLGEETLSILKRTGIPGLVKSFNQVPIHDRVVPPPGQELRSRLRQYYSQEIEELESLFDRDLSHWT